MTDTHENLGGLTEAMEEAAREMEPLAAWFARNGSEDMAKILRLTIAGAIMLRTERDGLLARAEAAEAALAFYADQANWSDARFINDAPGVLTSQPSSIDWDRGRRARTALGQDAPEDKLTWARVLRGLRRLHDEMLFDMGRRLGLEPVEVSQIERGVRPPPADLAHRVIAAYSLRGAQAEDVAALATPAPERTGGAG